MSADARTRQPTPKAAKDCAAWLALCLRLGWERDQLDFLETLWWKYHDDRGMLINHQANA